MLAPRLREHGLEHSAALHDFLSADTKLGASFQRLREWRNTDLGHGLVGREERLIEIFDLSSRHARHARHEPVRHLARVLQGLSSWLAETQRRLLELGWPTLGGLPEAPAAERVPAPDPVAFLGDGAHLRVLERVTPSHLYLRDILTSELDKQPRQLDHRHLVELLTQLDESDPLDPTYRTLELAEEAESAAACRAMKTPLVDRLLELVPEHRIIAVTGGAGAGKSVLSRQLAREVREGALPERWVVLAWFAQPGLPFSRASLPGPLEQQVRAAGLLPVVDEGGAPRSLPSDPEGMAEWFGQLSIRNRGTRFLLVLDGLEEMHGEQPLDGLPLHDSAFTTVLGYRELGSLTPSLHRAISDLTPGATLDLDGFYETDPGRKTLLSYLRKRHRPLKGLLDTPMVAEDGSSLPLGQVILQRAQSRFLWVFHYARGLEVGFIQPGVPLDRWPQGQEFYRAYLDWMEARVGRHPGYCRCLRQVLLTLAEARIPINDRTLLWLLDEGPGVRGRESGEFAVAQLHREWVRPVLRDLRDFLVRRRVGVDATDGTDRRAFLVVVFDAEKRPADGMVRSLAHDTLAVFLGSEELATSWLGARKAVRAHLARRVFEGLEAGEDAAMAGLTAPVRYAQQRGGEHVLAGSG